MLTPELAQEIATSITAAIEFNVLVTDRQGRVIGSADPTRVGTVHEASLAVVRRRTGHGTTRQPRGGSPE